MTLLATTILLAATTRSGAPDVAASPALLRGTKERLLLVRAPEHCPAAQRAIGYYRRAYTASRTTMGLPGAPPRAWYPCDTARRRAVEWRDRAKTARLEIARWQRDQFDWWRWLPANWAALGACETGYGKRPGNWAHDSGQYVSAFGIARVNYALDAHRIGNLSWDETKARLHRLPTPREQLDAAISHYETYGDGWGCPGP